MTKPTVFISYSHKDADWVRGWLLPHLEDADLQVCIDFRDFEIGVPILINMERAVEHSQKTLLVLTPNWVESEWTNFEALMLQTQDPIGRARRMLPLMLEDCTLPSRLAIFTWADFRRRENWETELSRLLRQIKEEREMPAVRVTATPAGPQKISLAKLPSTSPDLFGRQEELALLDAAWDDAHTNVLSLVAWGGVGKTALVNTWLLQMGADNYRGAARVYGWSFYSQGAAEGKQASADPFIAAALAWFGDRDPTAGSPWDKGERLAELVTQQRTLLILDGLEPLQYPPGEMGGRLKDPGLCCLLRGLARHNPGLCIITTRLKVDDLKDFVGGRMTRVDLEDLSPEAGAAYLAHLGVKGTPKELRQAVGEFGGHALALTLLGSYLTVVYAGDIRQRDKIARLSKEKRQGGHARRVMESYARWFKGQPELDILRIMGLFDRPAEGGALAALRAEPAIAGLTTKLQGLPHEDWQYAVDNLRTARLLAQQDPHTPDTLDCHPLVREHFGEKLEQSNPGAWKEAHSRLYEVYKSQAPELPDTIEEMVPLYAAVAHGCQAGRHQEALEEVYRRRILRDRRTVFSWRNLGAFGADLAALSSFFDLAWSHPVTGDLIQHSKASLLTWTGFCLRTLGRLTEAVKVLQHGLDVATPIEDWENATDAARYLSEIWLILGNIVKAVDYGRKSVDLADRSGDGWLRLSSRAALADAQHQAGNCAEAEAAFHEAEKIQKERQPSRPILYHWQGFRYCDLLLDQGKSREVKFRSIQTLEIAREEHHLLANALDSLSLGRAHLFQAQQKGTRNCNQAKTHLDQAVDGLRQAGQQDQLPRGLLARAELRRVSGDLQRAQTDLEEALSITTRGGMRLHEADCHLAYARLYLARGEEDKARESLDKAKAMIEEMGYHRRDGEVAALEKELGGTEAPRH